MTAYLHRLLDLWLGTDPAQRVRLRQTSLAMALMVLCMLLLLRYTPLMGKERGPLLWTYFTVALCGMAGFYAAIRSGWSRRFADPSLTSLQMAFAITIAGLGYSQAGPMRGAVFPVLTLILMFGMFQLRARTAYALSGYTLLLFGFVMALMAQRRPEVYLPPVEFGSFLMLACMLPASAALTAQLSLIRRRLSEQRKELAAALDQLQAIATRDELTGLPNRRQMQALMDQELLRALRHQHDFCIAVLDLDHFKRINDVHGHAAGDAVLRAFAQAGLAALRATDVLARWGGEEFIALLPDTSMPPALLALERLRQQVETLRLDANGQTLTTTVSIGLTGHRRGETLAQTLERADQLLYKAKSQGRNRICSHPL